MLPWAFAILDRQTVESLRPVYPGEACFRMDIQTTRDRWFSIVGDGATFIHRARSQTRNPHKLRQINDGYWVSLRGSQAHKEMVLISHIIIVLMAASRGPLSLPALGELPKIQIIRGLQSLDRKNFLFTIRQGLRCQNRDALATHWRALYDELTK